MKNGIRLLMLDAPLRLFAKVPFHQSTFRASTHWSSEAMRELTGTGYYLGRGVPRDEARALQWYRQAAQAGDVGAQYLLASMYETGLGTEADLRLARYWYDVAARQGDEAASGKRDEVSRRLAAPSL